MRAPVAFMIFNRPDLTERVFAEIARAKPDRLFVIADGPRAGVADDEEKCRAARAVIEKVDWPCEVSTNYSDVNLGCAHRPSSGLRWLFEQVDEAVILEDDCLPHPSFFRFCDELLERYRDDTRVMHVSGNQFLTKPPTSLSYLFSRYCLSWGWATWRRAFQYYDFNISLWPELRDTGWLVDNLRDAREVDHWRRIFDRTHADVAAVNTWDFQWVFACWAQSGLSVLPSVNLVSNIGFRSDATHTKEKSGHRANGNNELSFPLRHPAHMVRDLDADALFFDTCVPGPGRIDRLKQRCADALTRMVRDPLRRGSSVPAAQ
jgi:hypothetical protein